SWWSPGSPPGPSASQTDVFAPSSTRAESARFERLAPAVASALESSNPYRVSYGDTLQVGFPRPGRVLRGVLIGVFAVWLAFAVGLNWASAPESVFFRFAGDTERILRGELWRLLTAPWLHLPSGTIGHVLSALLGLYFLAPSLEERWGGRRFAGFLFFSAIFAYAFQIVVELLLPARLATRLVPAYWFGAMPVVEAVAIAWALSFRGQTVRLFFI